MKRPKTESKAAKTEKKAAKTENKTEKKRSRTEIQLAFNMYGREGLGFRVPDLKQLPKGSKATELPQVQAETEVAAFGGRFRVWGLGFRV